MPLRSFIQHSKCRLAHLIIAKHSIFSYSYTLNLKKILPTGDFLTRSQEFGFMSIELIK